MTQTPADINQADVVLRNDGATVVAGIPQFGIFARADSVKAALDALEVKKQAVAADLATFADLQSARGAPREPVVRWREVATFSVKALIVLAVLIAASMFMAIKSKEIVDAALGRMESRLAAVTQGLGAGFWPNLERELDRAAGPNGDLPPEKKEKILNDLRVIVQRWRPYVAEVQGLFEEPAPPGTTPPPQ